MRSNLKVVPAEFSISSQAVLLFTLSCETGDLRKGGINTNGSCLSCFQ
jgi:hypothetical protein